MLFRSGEPEERGAAVLRCERVDELGRQCVLTPDHQLARDHFYAGLVPVEPIPIVEKGQDPVILPRLDLNLRGPDVEAIAIQEAYRALAGLAREALPRILVYLMDRLPVQGSSYRIEPEPYETEQD